MEEELVAPRRVVLEQAVAAEGPPRPVLAAQEDPGQPRRQSSVGVSLRTPTARHLHMLQVVVPDSVGAHCIHQPNELGNTTPLIKYCQP